MNREDRILGGQFLLVALIQLVATMVLREEALAPTIVEMHRLMPVAITLFVGSVGPILHGGKWS